MQLTIDKGFIIMLNEMEIKWIRVKFNNWSVNDLIVKAAW